MCGIFGCIGKIDYKTALQCVKRIQHRGPDALGVKELSGATLGHVRLAILDVSEEANQPMSDFTGRYWIVYNGEIYNFLELQKDLMSKGYKFRTQSDTEVLLYSYIEWGEQFQYKCNGMWALAIWDDLEKKLFLSRDRFGIKPLYIYQENGNFYFASEMKAFFPIMKERMPNYMILLQKDFFNYEATHECVIRGIKKILAGAYGILENSNFVEKRWWNTLEHLIEVPELYEKQVELFRELFLDACRIRMRSDVPIGTALSGGIDSSSTMGAMHYLSEIETERMSNDWQHAFVAHMPNTSLDETRYADFAAEYIGISANHVSINPQIGVNSLLQYLYMCEDPYNTSPVPFMQTYERISSAGIKVTLDGHGADELFGGYGFDLFSIGNDIGIDTKEFYGIIDIYNEIVMDYQKIGVNDAEKRVQNYKKNWERYKISDKKFEVMDGLNKQLYIETHYSTLPTLFRCYDKYSMANGIEIRMPFMDYRIVCFAFSIPWYSKIRKGYTKAIVRDMAKPFVDSRILERKLKIGFNAPCTEWFRGELKEFLLDIIHSRDFIECGLVNALEVCIKVNEFWNKKEVSYQDGASLWTAIVPYLWKKAVIDCGC